MNDKFAKRLEEFLASECGDYSIKWSYKWDEDTQCCEVNIADEIRKERYAVLNFRYDNKKDDLKVELSEDNFYTTREFDWTVKYFWMLVSPSLFPDI